MSETHQKNLNGLLHQAARRQRVFSRLVRRNLARLWRRYFGRKIPLAMVTGTKGKTTTVRMLAHILTVAGHRVGFTSTDGVVIDGECLEYRDSACYDDAATVYWDKNVTAAVLEAARGGLIQKGPYVDRCHAGVLLNVGREHIGTDGIETVEQMAQVKRQVVDAARDVVVLNADDEHCVRLLPEYPVKRVVLFSLQEDNSVATRHLEAGGAVLKRTRSSGQDRIVRCEGKSVETLVPIDQLPACRNGLFPQNIANAMAAAALAEGLSVSREDVRKGLKTFSNSVEQAPGKLNFMEGYSQTIIIDNAGQPPACEALVKSLNNLQVPGKRICILQSVGNRPEWHFDEMTAAMADCFDHFICYELEEYRRGREPGEIAGLLRSGLIKAGVSEGSIELADGYEEASRKLSQEAAEGDLLVILIAAMHDYLPVFEEVFSSHRKP